MGGGVVSPSPPGPLPGSREPPGKRLGLRMLPYRTQVHIDPTTPIGQWVAGWWSTYPSPSSLSSLCLAVVGSGRQAEVREAEGWPRGAGVPAQGINPHNRFTKVFLMLLQATDPALGLSEEVELVCPGRHLAGLKLFSEGP